MVNVSGIAGTTMGIMGMGIGIGIVAHTAKNVMQMTDSMYKTPRRRPKSYTAKPIKIKPIKLNTPVYKW